MASEAFITAQLDIEVDKAREKIAAFVREVQQNPIRVGVEIDRKGDRTTMSGQVVSGVDAEHASAGGTSRREGVVDAQAELQRRTLWASSLGGNTGGPTGFIPPTAAMNSVYGSMGHGRAAGPFGTTQVLPGMAAQRPAAPAALNDPTGLRSIGGIGGGIAEAMYDRYRSDVRNTGQLPPQEAKSLLGQVYGAASRQLGPGLPALEQAIEITKAAGGDAKRASALFNEAAARKFAPATPVVPQAASAAKAVPAPVPTPAAAVPVPLDVVAQAQSRSRAAQWKDDQDRRVAAVRYGQYERRAQDAGFVGPLTSPQNFASPGGRAEAMDEVSRAREMRAGELRRARAASRGANLDRSPGDSRAALLELEEYRFNRYRRLAGEAGIAEDEIFDRQRFSTPVGREMSRDQLRQRRSRGGFFSQSLGRFGDGLGTLIGVTGAVALAQNSLGAINARELAFAQAGGDPMALARAGIDNDLGTSLGRAIPLVGQLGGEISEFFTGNRTAAERTFQAAGIQDRVTASMVQRGDLQRQATQATGVARAGLAGQSAAQIASIANLRADIDDGVTRRAYLAANGQAERDQLIAAGERVNQVRSAGTSIGSRLQSFVSTGSTAGDTQAAAKALADAESAYETARQQVAKVEAKADDYVAQIRSANEAQREVIRQSASDARTTTNQTTEGVSAAFARTVGGDRFGGQQAMLEATIAPQIEQINREIARLDNVEGSGDLIRERVAAREALQQQLDRGTQQNSLDAGRFRILQQGQVQAGRLNLAFNPVGGQLASLQSGFSADTLGMDQSSPDFRRRQEQFSVDVDSVSQAATIRRRSLGNSLRAESRSLDFAQSRNIVGAEAAILAGDAENTLQSLAQSGVGEDQIDIARANFSRRIDLQRQQYAEGFRATQFDGFNLAIAPRDVVDPAAAFAALDEAQRNILGVDAYAGRVIGGEAGIGGEAAVTALTELNQKVERLALVVEGWNQRR